MAGLDLAEHIPGQIMLKHISIVLLAINKSKHSSLHRSLQKCCLVGGGGNQGEYCVLFWAKLTNLHKQTHTENFFRRQSILENCLRQL